MKTVRRLPLNSLRVFEAVARYGSMAKAAEALHVQPSAVSMHMKNLAAYVGTALVTREGASLRLTAPGEQLLPEIRSGLTQIDRAVERVRKGARQRTFRLTVLPAFLQKWLLPRMSRFGQQHPAARLKIVADRHLTDIAGGQADAGIRLGAGSWPGLDAVHLMDEHLVPVCAPAVAQRIGHLAVGTVPEGWPLFSSDAEPWSLWTEDLPARDLPSVDFADVVSVIHAACAGSGVALVRASLVLEDIVAGRLVLVGPAIRHRWSYHFVSPQGMAPSRTQALLIDWLRGECRNHDAAFSDLLLKARHQPQPGMA